MTTTPAPAPTSEEIGRTLDLSGCVCNVHDRGSGAPVLFIHGSGPGVSAWANWRLVLPALAGEVRAIAPDMLGFGYTETKPGVQPGIDSWLRQLTDLLDALALPRVSIVGNSFGGSIALRFAARFAERVDRLVLMGPAGVSFPITDELDKVWGYEPSLENMEQLLRIFAFDQSILSSDLAQMRYRASIRGDVQQRYASLFPAPRQRWVDYLASGEADLARIDKPTLIIHGRQDRVIPFSASERLAKLLPNATLLPVDRCGHWVQIEHTALFLEALRSFLNIGPARQA